MAAAVLTGHGRGFAGCAAGEIGRIGHAAMKTAGGKYFGKMAQVGAYTLHTERQIVAPGVLQCGAMGSSIQLDADNVTAFVLGAQE